MADEPQSAHSAKSAGAPRSAVDPAWSDASLLAAVKAREPSALGRFFDLAFPYVYSLAYRFTRQRETAEDMTQEVFLKVYNAADRLATDRSAKPWITAITVNACRDHARRRAARPEDSVDALVLDAVHSAPGTPEQDLMRAERDRQLDKALDQLDFESRLVVLLHNFSDYSHESIAQLMGTSHDAVRKRYSRALRRLAGIIGEAGT